MTDPLKTRIFLVEDVLPQAEIYASYMRIAGYDVALFDTSKSAQDALTSERPGAVVLDLHLPDGNGMDIMRTAHRLYAGLPVIVVTSDSSAEAAVSAMQEGAYDFILKPFQAPRLIVTLHNALQHLRLSQEIAEWRRTLGQNNFHGFVGQAPNMQAVYRIIDSVAASRASVFITGESGTGKELAAQALHLASPRKDQPFVALNCGAIPQHLLESQIFGHVKGAFTGAVATQEGAARKANNGTLFLDEVCELPLELQVKLLRFLQTSEITPVGSNEIERLDLRIIAATNRDPLTEVRAGRFREDLYYRLHVVPLELPPLRERGEDIVMLADHFLSKYNVEEKKHFQGFMAEVLRLFRRYEWPGNVRQLENTIHQIVALHDSEMVQRAHLPDSFLTLAGDSASAAHDRLLTDVKTTHSITPLWLVEKNAILQALTATQQDVVKAAALLEVSPSTLYRKLQAWKTGKDNA